MGGEDPFEDTDFSDPSDVWCCFNKWCVGSILVPYFIIGPAVLLYIGFAYHYCEDIFSIWLIVGGFLVYLADGLFLWTWYVNRTFSYKKLKNKRAHFTFLAVAVLVVIWWVCGFARIFGPARKIMKTGIYDPNDIGIYGLPFMDDPECRAHLYEFPWWLMNTTFIILGWFLVSIFVYACLGCLDND